MNRISLFVATSLVAGLSLCALVGCPTKAPSPPVPQGGMMAEAVPISISITEETVDDVRRLKVQVTWNGRYEGEPVLRMTYDVRVEGEGPPYTHLNPQLVVGVTLEKHWKVKEVDVIVDSGEKPTWTFYLPVVDTYSETSDWKTPVHVYMSATLEVAGYQRGTAGWTEDAVAPPVSPAPPVPGVAPAPTPAPAPR